MSMTEQQLRNSALKKINATRAVALANQENEYRFNYNVKNAVVAAGSVVLSRSVQIGADADFQLLFITGDFVKASGVEPTISVKITDQGRGNTLTDGFIPLNLFLTPGEQSFQLFNPYKFKYIFKRTSTILFEFINSDVTNAGTVNIVLHGKKWLRY